MTRDISEDPTTQPAAADVLRLVMGYQIAQAIYVATALGVPDCLSGGPTSGDELARITGTHAPSLARLLRALAAFDVLREVEPGHFALAPMGGYLRDGAPGSLRDLVLMYGSENFWRTWGDLLHSVRTGESAVSHLFGARNPFDYYARRPEVAATVNAGMTALAAVSAPAVVAAYDFARFGVVVDVGGGHGYLLAAILRAHPTLHGVLFDLPHVVAGAGRLLEAEGVAPRCRVVGGDLFASVPAGGDAYVLSRVLHDWDDDRAVACLRSCRRAMPGHATLLLVERVRPARVDRSAAARAQVLSDLNMLVRTGGRERTAEEYGALLGAAGFALRAITKTRGMVSVIDAARA